MGNLQVNLGGGGGYMCSLFKLFFFPLIQLEELYPHLIYSRKPCLRCPLRKIETLTFYNIPEYNTNKHIQYLTEYKKTSLFYTENSIFIALIYCQNSLLQTTTTNIIFDYFLQQTSLHYIANSLWSTKRKALPHTHVDLLERAVFHTKEIRLSKSSSVIRHG